MVLVSDCLAHLKKEKAAYLHLYIRKFLLIYLSVSSWGINEATTVRGKWIKAEQTKYFELIPPITKKYKALVYRKYTNVSKFTLNKLSFSYISFSEVRELWNL